MTPFDSREWALRTGECQAAVSDGKGALAVCRKPIQWLMINSYSAHASVPCCEFHSTVMEQFEWIAEPLTLLLPTPGQ